MRLLDILESIFHIATNQQEESDPAEIVAHLWHPAKLRDLSVIMQH